MSPGERDATRKESNLLKTVNCHHDWNAKEQGVLNLLSKI